MILHRVPIHDVSSLDDVAAFVSAAGGGRVVVFDADNTLVRQGAPLDEFGAAVNSAIDRFDALIEVDRVIVLTNGPERGVSRMISRGNKPWTTRRRLALKKATPIVVTGDQILTDGLLAWRLGATFLHLVVDEGNEAKSQAVMRRVGSVAAALFFRRNEP